MKNRLSQSLLMILALAICVWAGSTKPATAAPAPGGGPSFYDIDPAHASIAFQVVHIHTNIYGLFTDTTGSFSLEKSNPAADSFNITIKTGSIFTGQPKRDEHLKSPDFFSVKEFPTITFKSTKVVAGSKSNTFDVTGDLTLHGVTKPITITVTNTGDGELPAGTIRTSLISEFTIKRSDYGMTTFIPVVSDEIKLMIGIEGILQAPSK